MKPKLYIRLILVAIICAVSFIVVKASQEAKSAACEETDCSEQMEICCLKDKGKSSENDFIFFESVTTLLSISLVK